MIDGDYRIAGNFWGGANFRYFRDYPASHEIFYPRIFPPTNFQSVIDVIRVSGFDSFSRKFAPLKITRYTVYNIYHRVGRLYK